MGGGSDHHYNPAPFSSSLTRGASFRLPSSSSKRQSYYSRSKTDDDCPVHSSGNGGSNIVGGHCYAAPSRHSSSTQQQQQSASIFNYRQDLMHKLRIRKLYVFFLSMCPKVQ